MAMTTLILTHGFGGTSADWNQQVDHLRDAGRIVTWDLPGHGERAGLGGVDWSANHTVAMLAQLVADHEAPVLLGGHSLGAYLTLRCAVAHEFRLAGLVLICSGPGFRDWHRRERWNKSIDELASRMGLPPWVAQIGYLTDSLVIESLNRVNAPSLVIVGELDRADYLAGSNYLATHLAHAEMITIAGARHSPHITHPTETNDAIRRFMRHVSR